MTPDIKGLVTYIRSVHEWCARTKSGGDWFAIDPDESPFKAADALETLAGERDEWEKAARNHMDWRERNRERANAAESERDRLKAALEGIGRQHLITEMSDEDLDGAIEEGYDQCILTARKALRGGA